MSTRRRFARSTLALALGLACGSAAAQQHSTVWWDESEEGWGLYIADQGNVLAPFWFTNDEDGEPVWFLAPTTRQSDGSYRGTIERIEGVPLAQIAGQAADPGVEIGSAVLDFADDGSLAFQYTVGGQTQNKTLKRFAFGNNDKDVVCQAAPADRSAATNFSDIWWNPQSAGWGLHLSHIDNSLLATWYTYDTDGEPIFYQGVTTRQSDGSFSGELYRSNDGTPFLQIDGAPATDGASVVGSMRLRFSDGQNATFDYTVNGVTQSKTVQRFLFGDSASVCAVQDYDDGGDGGDGGQGDSCFPPYAVGNTREVRFSEVGADGQTTSNTRTETVVGEGTFRGQAALIEEYSGQTSAGNGVYARNYAGNGDGTIISFGAEAFDPSSGALLATSVNEPIRIETPRSFAIGQSVELRWRVNSSASGFSSTEQLRYKLTLTARESVTVPAGTFTACKFATETDLDSTISGVTISVRRTGTNWTHPQFGSLKFEDSGEARISGPVSLTQPVNSRIELLSARMGGVSTP